MDGIKALIKFMYSELFCWLVAKINEAHAAARLNEASAAFIGILDIFGFEIMKTNSFEQLCINFANEVLQKQFNEYIFVREQEIYAREGLDTREIVFRDNQGLIDLISKKPVGILPICEEHVMLSFKRDADNMALLNAMHKAHGGEGPKSVGGNEFYLKPRFTSDPNFTVKHFAGDVKYTIDDFIEKNRDGLVQNMKEMLVDSSSSFMLNLFGVQAKRQPDSPGYIASVMADGGGGIHGDEFEGGNEGGGGGRSSSSKKEGLAAMQTVSLRFRGQLEKLTATLRSTQPHYIKCVKPNSVKAAGALQAKLVVEQLRYSGVLEMVRIRQEGYPTRLPFRDVFLSLKALTLFALEGEHKAACEAAGVLKMVTAASASAISAEQAKVVCVALTGQFLGADDGFQLGKTKLFMQSGVMSKLNEHQDALLADSATTIQKQVRCILETKRYQRLLKFVIMVQAAGRRANALRKFATMITLDRLKKKKQREKEDRCAKRLQTIARQRAEEKTFAKKKWLVTAIATRHRMRQAAKVLGDSKARVLAIKHNHAAQILQRSLKKCFYRIALRRAIEEMHTLAAKGQTQQLLRMLDQKALSGASRAPGAKDLRALRLRAFQFRSLLHSAALSGSQALVNELKPTPAELAATDSKGNTTLHYAAASTSLDLIKYLLSEHFCPDAEVSTADVNAGHITSHARAPSISPDNGRSMTLNAELKSGWLKKRRETDKFRKRWCTLRQKTGLEYRDTMKSPKPSLVIPLSGAILKRSTHEEFAFEVHSPELAKLKKKNKENRLYFQAEDEISFNEWYTVLRTCVGSTATIREKRSKPMHFVNMGRRSEVLMRCNNNGESMHHCAVTLGIKAGLDPKVAREWHAVQTVVWLVENGCDVNSTDDDGRTVLHSLLDADHPSPQVKVLFVKHFCSYLKSLANHLTEFLVVPADNRSTLCSHSCEQRC
jgi:hypothetical protein